MTKTTSPLSEIITYLETRITDFINEMTQNGILEKIRNLKSEEFNILLENIRHPQINADFSVNLFSHQLNSLDVILDDFFEGDQEDQGADEDQEETNEDRNYLLSGILDDLTDLENPETYLKLRDQGMLYNPKNDLLEPNSTSVIFPEDILLIHTCSQNTEDGCCPVGYWLGKVNTDLDNVSVLHLLDSRIKGTVENPIQVGEEVIVYPTAKIWVIEDGSP